MTKIMTIDQVTNKFFHVDPEHWNILTSCIKNNINILLLGPAGCGKSELARLAAKACGKNDHAFNMGAMSEPRSSLIGNVHFNKEKGTWFSQSRFVKAISNSHNNILLDEISRCNSDATNILLPLLDDQGYLALDETEETAIINKANDVNFVATANIGIEYSGTNVLDRALSDRFSVILDLNFPTETVETEILIRRTGVNPKIAEKLSVLAAEQRRQYLCSNFPFGVSTRMLLAASNLIVFGLPMESVLSSTITNHFSNEGGTESYRTKFKLLIQKLGTCNGQ